MSSESTQEQKGAPLNDKLLASITQHLNQDHLEDLLACAKATEGFNWVEQVKVTQLEATGVTLDVNDSTQEQSLQLDFPTTAEGVMSLQRIMVAMFMESRAKLGWDAAVDNPWDNVIISIERNDKERVENHQLSNLKSAWE